LFLSAQFNENSPEITGLPVRKTVRRLFCFLLPGIDFEEGSIGDFMDVGLQIFNSAALFT